MPTVADLFYDPLTGKHLPASRTNEILHEAMTVMGLDGWPEGEDPISHEQMATVRRNLGLFGQAAADATTTDEAATRGPVIPDPPPSTVAALIDLVSEDPDHKVINQLAQVLTTCMRVMDSDGWPDGQETITRFQSVTILRMLGYHDPAADDDGDSGDGGASEGENENGGDSAGSNS